jgi:hypothetical protein
MRLALGSSEGRFNLASIPTQQTALNTLTIGGLEIAHCVGAFPPNVMHVRDFTLRDCDLSLRGVFDGFALNNLVLDDVIMRDWNARAMADALFWDRRGAMDPALAFGSVRLTGKTQIGETDLHDIQDYASFYSAEFDQKNKVEVGDQVQVVSQPTKPAIIAANFLEPKNKIPQLCGVDDPTTCNAYSDRYMNDGNLIYFPDPLFVRDSFRYAIMTTEVTQRQWFDVMGENPSKHSESKYCADNFVTLDWVGVCPSLPVENVTRAQVDFFIRRLNQRSETCGMNGDNTNGYGCYFLPSFVQWEYAAAEQRTAYVENSIEANDWKKFAWLQGESSSGMGWATITHSVGTKLPNSEKIYDMQGNVSELVSDYRDGSVGASFMDDDVPVWSDVKRTWAGGGGYIDRPKTIRGSSAPYETVGFRLAKHLAPAH